MVGPEPRISSIQKVLSVYFWGIRNLIGTSKVFSVSRKFFYDTSTRDVSAFVSALKDTVVAVEVEIEKTVPGAPSSMVSQGGWGGT
jgi:hypothetical protein